jgi:DNA helicase-2/ATP-dependent DNA helicase PcrA
MTQQLVNDRINDAVLADAAYLMVTGGAGTGKSFVVVKRVQRLLAQGVAPRDILVVLPGANAAAELRRHLEAMLALGAAGVRITTIHDLCVDILSTSDALAATGRCPRVINNIENIFLLEDLKTLGIKPRRLKEMLKFFYREWTELGDARDDFFIAQEEELVHSTVKNLLVARGAMLEPELSNITVNYLRGHATARTQIQVPHVLVDDYPCLNKASQQVCCLLAAQSLVVTGNPCQAPGMLEPYPWPQGLADFAAASANVEKIELVSTVRCPQKVASCGNALLLRGSTAEDGLVAFDEGTSLGRVALVKWVTPSQEFAGIADYLCQRLGGVAAGKRGKDDNRDSSLSTSSKDDNTPVSPTAQALDPKDVLVVVPNRAWGRMLEKHLKSRGVQTSSILASTPLGGNPREKKSSVAMRTFTLLNLIAHPTDIVAWRSWCGFDDYLANSAPWATLSAWANESGLGLLEALERLATTGAEDITSVPAHAQVLKGAYCEGKRIIAACADKQGGALIDALGQQGYEVPPELEILLVPITNSDTAMTLYTRAARKALEPVFEAEGAVRIGTPESLLGLEAKLVVLAGLVNGFVPTRAYFSTDTAPDARARLLNRERLQLYTALTRSSAELVLSYFQKEKLLQAEPLGMEIGRIRMERGERLALVPPSEFLAEMGDALPSAVGAL